MVWGEKKKKEGSDAIIISTLKEIIFKKYRMKTWHNTLGKKSSNKEMPNAAQCLAKIAAMYHKLPGATWLAHFHHCLFVVSFFNTPSQSPM